MADSKPDSKESKPENPRVAEARRRAAELAKATGGSGRARQSTGQFFQEVWSELKKTTWPDRDTLTKSVYVVLAFIATTGVWIFVISYVLGQLTKPLFGK